MKQSERIQIYKELYLLEIDNKSKIDARLNLPLAIVVGLISLLAYTVQNVPKFKWELGYFFFWIPFALCIFFLFRAFLFFKESWFGQTDQLMPTAKDIKAYYETLECHYCSYDNKKDLVDKSFRDFLETSYSNYATTNAVNNDYRSYNLFKTTKSITIAIMFALFSLMSFYAISFSESSKNKCEVTINVKTQQPTTAAASGAGSEKCEGPSTSEEPTTTSEKPAVKEGKS